MNEDSKETLKLIGSILLIMLICMLIAIPISNAAWEKQQERERFLTDEHTCESCGWTGHTGQMTYHIDRNHRMYFCPTCGELLGEFY